MFVLYRNRNGRLRAKKAEFTAANQVIVEIPEDHIIVDILNDIGLRAVSPSFINIGATSQEVTPFECYILNNPIFDLKYVDQSDWRGPGLRVLSTNGNFYNPLGSGGGNTSEPIDPDQALIGTYSILTAFLGFQTYSGDLSASGSSLWMRHVFLDNTYIKVYNQQPDSSYTFNRDLRPDDAEYVANGHHRFVWSQNQIWSLRNLADDSPVYFEDGQTQKSFKWLKAFKTLSNGGEVWNSDGYDLRSVNDTNYFDVENGVISVYLNDSLEHNQLGWQIIQEPNIV